MSDARPVAIVTGAARGIGRACAKSLTAAGFEVLGVDLEPGNGSHVSLVADVADLATHARIVQTAKDRWGGVDCLVNNAGVGVLRRGDLLEVTAESYDRCMAVNTRAVFFLSQAVARAMLQEPSGARGAAHRSIVNITSSNAVAASISRGEYCVSKSASSMTSRLFALRLAEAGIGVYEIRPGVIETEMTRPVKEYYDERIDSQETLVPMRRWGQPEEVAETVRLLAEGRLAYATGQAISIDGGMTLLRY